MNREQFEQVVVAIIGLSLLVVISCGVSSCRKASLERIVGHPVSWWDYLVVTSK